MDHRQRTGEGRLLKIEVILAKLRRGEHALVDHAIGRQGADVKIFASRGRDFWRFKFDDVFSALPDDIQAALKFCAVVKGRAHADEDLANRALKDLLALAPGGGVLSQENHSCRVIAGGWKRNAQIAALGSQKRVWDSD